MMNTIKSFYFCSMLCLAIVNSLQAKDYSITDFGARADGKTINTSAIQLAIDKTSETGGGRVTIPAGIFLTGTVELKSNVELFLEKGSLLLGSTDPGDYEEYAGFHAMIIANNQENVSITGEGTIDGQGRPLALRIDSLNFAARNDKKQNDNTVKEEIQRPKIIHISGCTNVSISKITVMNAANWVEMYDGCENLTIDGIRVHSEAYHNNDGMDIMNCHNVKVTNCDLNVVDDGICFKGSWNDNVLVENCRIRSSASAVKFGSQAGATNVTIRNIYVYDTYRSAIAIESVDGFNVENILVDGLYVVNTWNVIFLRLGKRNLNDKGEPGTLKNITIRNVKASVPLARPDINYQVRFPGRSFPQQANIHPAVITGITDQHIENILLENIDITYPGGGDEGTGYMPLWRLQTIPEDEQGYPEYDILGELPSWAFFVRHTRGIQFKNVSVTAEKRDYRPAFVFDDVSDVTMNEVYIAENDKGPQIVLRRTNDINLDITDNSVTTVE